MKYNIGIDLGGTNIKVGLVDENYNIVAKATCKTDLPRPAEEIADSIAETVWKALNDAKVTIDELNSIGIGTPGTASRDTGSSAHASASRSTLKTTLTRRRSARSSRAQARAAGTL